jgi:hypothetical protein
MAALSVQTRKRQLSTDDTCSITANAPMTLKELQRAVQDIGHLSRRSLHEVATVAKLALVSLETSDAYKSPFTIGTLARTLEVIWGIADMAADVVGDEVDRAGFESRTAAEIRREEAWRASAAAGKGAAA